MNKIWFTSDTHFGSKRTLEFSKRPFKNVKEMDDTIIKNWNDKVDKSDIVIHLGDFGNYEKVKELNGLIKIIPGNYERDDIDFKKFKNYFYDVMGEDLSYCINDYKLTMSHEPSLIKHIPISPNNINIFGHIHKLCMIKPYGINVGVDCHDFTPIDMNTILFYHNAILNHYDNEVFN